LLNGVNSECFLKLLSEFLLILLIQNGNVYMTAELLCKQLAKSEEDLLDLYFLVTYFKTVISCIVSYRESSELGGLDQQTGDKANQSRYHNDVFCIGPPTW